MKIFNPKQRVLLPFSVIMITLLMPVNLAGQSHKSSNYSIPDGWYNSETKQSTEDSIVNLVVKVRNNKVVGIKTETGRLLSQGYSDYEYTGGEINCIVKNGKLVSAVAVVTVVYPKKRVVYKLTIKA